MYSDKSSLFSRLNEVSATNQKSIIFCDAIFKARVTSFVFCLRVGQKHPGAQVEGRVHRKLRRVGPEQPLVDVPGPRAEEDRGDVGGCVVDGVAQSEGVCLKRGQGEVVCLNGS